MSNRWPACKGRGYAPGVEAAEVGWLVGSEGGFIAETGGGSFNAANAGIVLRTPRRLSTFCSTSPGVLDGITLKLAALILSLPVRSPMTHAASEALFITSVSSFF